MSQSNIIILVIGIIIISLLGYWYVSTHSFNLNVLQPSFGKQNTLLGALNPMSNIAGLKSTDKDASVVAQTSVAPTGAVLGATDTVAQTSSTPQVTPIESYPFANITLRFGGATTNVSKISNLDATTYQNLTLEVPGKGKIVFTGKINLLDPDLAPKLADLDAYVRIEDEKVTVDSKSLPMLNTSADIFFYNVTLAGKTIRIQKDGIITSDFKNLKYDPDKDQLRLSVDGFSSYAISPNLSVNLGVFDNSSAQGDNYIVKGTVSDIKAKIYVAIGAKEATISDDPKPDGSFEIKIPKDMKGTKATIKAVGINGAEESTDFVVGQGGITQVLGVSTMNPIQFGAIGLIAICVIIVAGANVWKSNAGGKK